MHLDQSPGKGDNISENRFLTYCWLNIGFRCGDASHLAPSTWLGHIPPLSYPGQALAVALYEIGGIRSCEIGTVMFGRQPDGSEKEAAMDLVRLAMPRRTYTQSHADYIIEVFEELNAIKSSLKGFKIVKEASLLRHFTCHFEKCDLA